MKEKTKEFLEGLLMVVIMFSLFSSFILMFLYVEVHFFKCVCGGIIATITLLAFHWKKEIMCE